MNLLAQDESELRVHLKYCECVVLPTLLTFLLPSDYPNVLNLFKTLEMLSYWQLFHDSCKAKPPLEPSTHSSPHTLSRIGSASFYIISVAGVTIKVMPFL